MAGIDHTSLDVVEDALGIHVIQVVVVQTSEGDGVDGDDEGVAVVVA